MRRNILHKKDFYKVLSVSRCQDGSTLVLDDEIIQNIQDLEKNLEFNSSRITYDNITFETFYSAAKMFTYLNHCPPKIIGFYKELLKNSSIKDIFYVLNSIKKKSLNTAMESSTEILNQIVKMYNLTMFDEPSLQHFSEKTPHKIKELQISNHPVHIHNYNNNDKELSPTALIPFCSFSDNFGLMGEENLHFEVPVCNSFSAKVVNDQLCYTTDPNRLKNKIDFNTLLFKNKELSITLYIDYNEDRHWGKIENSESQNIRLETIGKYHQVTNIGKFVVFN